MKKTVKSLAIVCTLLLVLALTFTACNSADNGTEPTDKPAATKAPDNNGDTEEAKGDKTEDVKNNATEDPTEQKYESALALIDAGKIDDAYEALNEIKTYAPAQEKLKNFFYVPGMVVEASEYSDGSSLSYVSSYKYDSMGNIIERVEGADKDVFNYDSVGNILNGCDLIYGSECAYTYRDGRLYQISSEGGTETYHYNEKGQIAKVSYLYKYNEGAYTEEDEKLYEYTYYTNGNVKTLVIDECEEYHYDKNGRQTKLIVHDDYDDYAFEISYGDFGVKKINFNCGSDESATFEYTYGENGALSKLEVKYYMDNELELADTFTFSEQKLFYSENPAVKQRAAIVSYMDCEAILEIIW